MSKRGEREREERERKERKKAIIRLARPGGGDGGLEGDIIRAGGLIRAGDFHQGVKGG